MKVLPSITFAWRTNREGNDPWRPATKKIEFPWPSILGGICLAAGRQGSFPWRFSTAKVIPFWYSVQTILLFILFRKKFQFTPLSYQKSLIQPSTTKPEKRVIQLTKLDKFGSLGGFKGRFYFYFLENKF